MRLPTANSSRRDNTYAMFLLWLLWLFVLGTIYWFVLEVFRYAGMTSDSFLHSVELPEEMVNSGEFILKDFNYHNYDHRVAFIALAHTPGAFFFPAHAYGTYITGALILTSSFNAAMIWLLRSIKTKILPTMLVTLLFSLSYSGVVFQHIHGQHSYTLEAISIATILVSLLTFYKYELSRRGMFAIILISFILFTNCVIGLNRTLITLILPTLSVIGVMLLNRYVEFVSNLENDEGLRKLILSSPKKFALESRSPNSYFVLIATIVIGVVTGYLCYKFILANHSYTTGVSQNVDISNLANVFDRTKDFFGAIFKTLGYGFSKHLTWTSGLISLGAVLLLISFLLGFLQTLFIRRNIQEVVFYSFASALLFTHFLAFNLTRVAIEDRYTLSITILIFFCVMATYNATRFKAFKFIVLTSLVAYTSGAIMFTKGRLSVPAFKVKPFAELDAVLDKEGVTEGLAIYPVFGGVTLNTDAVVRPISLGRDGNLQRSALTHNRWLEIDQAIEKSLFVTQPGHPLSKDAALEDFEYFIDMNDGEVLNKNVVSRLTVWTVNGDVKRFIPYSAFEFGRPYSSLNFPIDDSTVSRAGKIIKTDEPQCKYRLKTEKKDTGIALSTYFIEVPKGNYALSLYGDAINSDVSLNSGNLFVDVRGVGRLSHKLESENPMVFSIDQESAMISVKISVEGEAINLCGWTLSRTDK